ncbi:hypothetical protein PUNSTDRAFT_73370 [Punctularia strigosozonata HHB-11173 SS5]|uniref:uncharacterized protein n=1 Tax=Punctularia strigosozonata (strain HHB-11173) TaxID=741275 RepID=UPI00044181CF|nr:uncharacterized protein PUNSTDRAFT_73370 [Punctularia strigosozonata HHB-11173 SS5]EIN06067.1 hypothetical protein PUNSTDRAFT_73370 [Punctularia strigosozonata HHB-11173 SS5]
MAPNVEDDWSDSDEEISTDVETDVLLGVPDGPLASSSDILDVAVSRIGGTPAFLLAREPPISSSECANCKQPMQLLVQMWCPFEDSPMDRAIYVWGCANPGCQRKEGSVRAWRGLRFNAPYAAKLEKKLARRRERERRKEEERAAAEAKKAQAKASAKANPFSVSQIKYHPLRFGGLGDQLFGSSAPPPSSTQAPDEVDERGSDSEEEESSSEPEPEDESESGESELVTAMAGATLDTSPWAAAPAYPAQYLSTTAEYLPPPPKAKLPAGVSVDDPDAESGKGKGGGGEWGLEGYENSMELDHVFERFTKRAGYAGEQCVRYDLKGTPLPYAADDVFRKLFPDPSVNPTPGTAVSVTRAAFNNTPAAARRTYSPASVPPCPACGGARVFECQLMPNLINVLRPKMAGPERPPAAADGEARRKEVEAALKTGIGMEWGTCMVFSCERDCCVGQGGKDEKEAWREEVVLVQWDD